MARLSEKNCLDSLMNAYFRDASAKGKIVFDNSNEKEFEKYLKSARDGDKDNEFPDFACDGAIIEHFEVTSSEEGNRGSAFRKDASKEGKKWNETFKKEGEKTPIVCPDPFSIPTTFISEVQTYDDFSYDSFVKSVINNIENHIQSKKKINKPIEKTIFLMEHVGGRLYIGTNEKSFSFYRISNDKLLLETLKKYSHDVDYLVYVAGDDIEIIDIGEIDHLIENSSYLYNVKAGKLDVVHLGFIFDF